jgi:hypothetical protein
MDYQIVLSPEFNINPAAFLSAWNDNAECRDIALAEAVAQPPAGYPLDPGTVLIFLGGVATTVATSVLTNVISKLLEQKFFDKEKKPAVEIMVIPQAPGSQLLVVKGPEQ